MAGPTGGDGTADEDPIPLSALQHYLFCPRQCALIHVERAWAENALLSLVYALLTHDCRAALETVGLDPAVGFLHRDRPGRPSLALDLLEEFRPGLADRLVLSLVNRRQVGPGSFRRLENGAVLLADEARKDLLVAFQERKKEELLHPYLQEKAPMGLMPHLQAQLLARHLRGDLDAYPPFVGR